MTDLLILGGGLAGGLAALALKQRRPELEVVIIEQDEKLGGNHVWSFFDSDVAPENRSLVDPFIVQHWECNQVRFPARKRTLNQPYNSIRSDRFDEQLRRALGKDAVRHERVSNADATGIELASGERLQAKATLDTRGVENQPPGLECGWQKFVGQMLDVEGGHGLTNPVIMDATVDQADGYRFVYCLPFDETRVFVEDTYYHDQSDIDRDLLAGRIADYARNRGWSEHRVLHEEKGVLPVVVGGDFQAFWPDSDPVARAGARGGFFHPLTSYSLPDAVRFAAWLADVMPLDGEALAKATRERAQAHWQTSRFNRLLAKMLMRAADPPDRYRILQRFYGLPEELIARFYAGKTNFTDKVRILAGRPPVPLSRALRVVAATS